MLLASADRWCKALCTKAGSIDLFPVQICNMSLVSRLTPAGDHSLDSENFLEDVLGVVFEGDAKGLRKFFFFVLLYSTSILQSVAQLTALTISSCLDGDSKHGLVYTSPHLS